jgi:hypothetical protein
MFPTESPPGFHLLSSLEMRQTALPLIFSAHFIACSTSEPADETLPPLTIQQARHTTNQPPPPHCFLALYRKDATLGKLTDGTSSRPTEYRTFTASPWLPRTLIITFITDPNSSYCEHVTTAEYRGRAVVAPGS